MGEAKRRTGAGNTTPPRPTVRSSDGGLARELLQIAKAHRAQAGVSPAAVLVGIRVAVANGANWIGLFADRGIVVGGKPTYDLYLYDGAGESTEAGLSAFIVRGDTGQVDALRAEIDRLLPGAVFRQLN